MVKRCPNELKIRFPNVGTTLNGINWSNVQRATKRRLFRSTKDTPNVWLDWSLTKERIGQQLKDHYRACTSEELPPRLLVLIKKLDEENEPSMEQSQTIRDGES
jgi:hypothetical protein